MKYGVWIVAALSAAATFSGLSRPVEAAESLNLRRVMLSTGGVGYFEHEAKVLGDADLKLSVRLDQVNDVLKSIVVYDTSGRLGEVSLEGKELLTEAFRDLPFSESALASPAELLNALRGAEVRAELPGRVVSGRVVSVSTEQSTLPGGGTVTRHRLTLLSNGALQQVIVEEIERLTVVDAALQEKIDLALAALARQRERNRRELTIRIAGTGERLVRVGYVAEVPLWKTTYRMVLASEPEVKTAELKGFAVVENRSGSAWNNVDLTLVSGNPVTFRQAIYETYYVKRPEVPVEVLGRVLPRPDEGGVPKLEALENFDGFAMSAVASRPMGARGFAASSPPPPLAPITPPLGSEDATQVVFQMSTPVSIKEGESTLLPLIERSLPAERVSLYQPDIEKRHPLSSVSLVNNGETDLPPGALSIYERSQRGGSATYVGDARLSLMPVGASRFVSFAVDLRVTVDRDERVSQTLTVAKIASGLLQLTRTERKATTYTIVGAAREARTLIIEHPRVTGFELAPSEDFTVVELTATHYRLRRQIPAGGKIKLSVILERPLSESVALTDLSKERLSAYVTSSELPRAVRQALSRIADLQATVAGKRATLDKLLSERAQITEDQARVRENLKAVPAGSDLYKRYLVTLEQEEDRLEALRGEITAAESAVAAARQALAEVIRELKIP
jgi:hypothetical protein